MFRAIAQTEINVGTDSAGPMMNAAHPSPLSTSKSTHSDGGSINNKPAQVPGSTLPNTTDAKHWKRAFAARPVANKMVTHPRPKTNPVILRAATSSDTSSRARAFTAAVNTFLLSFFVTQGGGCGPPLRHSDRFWTARPAFIAITAKSSMPDCSEKLKYRQGQYSLILLTFA